MKKLILCEGANELALMEILLDHHCLQFDKEDVVNMKPYHARQLDSPIIKNALHIYPGDFEILRIGDTMKDIIKLKGYEEKVKGNIKICTKPEIEILLIIAEGRLKDFEKVKSKMKAKTYAKEHIRYHRIKYNNQSSFYKDYFSGERIDLLLSSIREYKRSHRHQKDEKYLADLLK